MKKFCSMLVMILCFCSFAYAEPISITWDRPVDVSNWAEVTEFDLQLNDSIIKIEGNVQEWSGDIVLVEGTNVAKLRAVTPTDESDWSEPCYFTRPILHKLFCPTTITIIIE